MSDPVIHSRQLDQNPDFVNAILNAAANLILVVDAKGHIVRFNRACEEATGYKVDEVVGRPFFDIFLRPEDREIKRVALESICNNSALATQINETEVVWLDKTGSPLCVAWKYTALCDATGQVLYIVSVGTEVSGQRRIEKALRDSEERYALALQGANDGIWDWNIKNGDVYFSPRWKAMLGYDEHEVGHESKDWWERVHPADKENLEKAIQQHLEGKTPHLECEYRILHKDGTYRWMLARGLAIRDENGQPYRIAGSQTDMTERKVTEYQLLHDVFHDSLTGLPNRVVFLERVEQMLARAKRKDSYRFAVLFLDLNGFKSVNDQLGHPIGDQLLKAVAARLKRCLRRDDTIAREAPQIEPLTLSLPGVAEMRGAKPKLTINGTQDMVARLGGDEFTVVLEDVVAADEVLAVARRIYQELDRPFNLSGQIVQVGVSIGIVLSSHQQSPDDLISQADAAMYEAKEKSKVSGQSEACIYEVKP